MTVQTKPSLNLGIQLWKDGLATQDVPTVAQWSADAIEALCNYMSNCKEAWHDDPDFADWYGELRCDAGGVIQALEQLQKTVQKYDITKLH